MKNFITAIILLFIGTSVFACQDNFSFSKDKQMHFLGSMAMAGTFTLVSDRPFASAVISSGIGVLKEVVDSRSVGHCASYHDAAYDVAGSFIGAYTAMYIKGLIIAPKKNGVMVGYAMQFN